MHKVIVINESTVTSVITDTFSFIVLVAILYMNHRFFDDSVFTKIIFFTIFLISCNARINTTKIEGKSEILIWCRKYIRENGGD